MSLILHDCIQKRQHNCLIRDKYKLVYHFCIHFWGLWESHGRTDQSRCRDFGL